MGTQLDYWNREDVDSHYDKNIVQQEVRLIKQYLYPFLKVLEVGCGEGEKTMEYSMINNIDIHSIDFSDTRLRRAAKRVGRKSNVRFKRVNMIDKDQINSMILDNCYDVVISERFLINILDWNKQIEVISSLKNKLVNDGLLLMIEGSEDGVKELNAFRKLFGLQEIPIRSHNLFLRDKEFAIMMTKSGWKLESIQGLGEYHLLTRGLRPVFDKELNWDSDFNKVAASRGMKEILKLGEKFSRLKFWVWRKVST